LNIDLITGKNKGNDSEFSDGDLDVDHFNKIQNAENQHKAKQNHAIPILL